MADDELPSGVVLLDRPRSGAPDDGDGPARETPAEPLAVVGLHPRMERRRLDVQLDRKRRRWRRALQVLAAIALLVVGAALAHTPAFDVDELRVEGVSHTSEAAVRWASGIHPGDALLTLDESGAERRIEELPWVARADVVREWPGTVRIAVREREPAAAVRSGDQVLPAVVDRTGRVLDIGALVLPGTVTVTGVAPGRIAEGEVLPAAARDALRLALGARERVPGAVASVSIELDATLTRGGIVRFGSAAALDEKLVALATFLTDVDLANLDVLDLRVPGSAAITRRR
jgi:cell division protein FtsQ